MKLALTVLVLVGVIGTLGRPSSDELRLIQVSETESPKWLTEDEVLSLIRSHVNFIDITDHQTPLTANAHSVFAYPSTIRFRAVVQNVFPKLSISRLESFVNEFATFNNRYYTSQTGVQSSAWLLSQATQAIASSGYSGQATVSAFTHSWAQSSVIARIEGADPILKTEVIVLGAHLDSVNSGNPAAGRAPGADDNGSGSAVLLETFRALLESGFIPKRTIEFQWYAAEEVGLRGSQDIATTYINQRVNVIAMFNYDVVGYNIGKTNIGIITDFTDAALSQFLRIVVDGYLNFGWTDIRCGYGCSDHASWNRNGFPAAMPVELDFHPSTHTIRDTIDLVNFPQVMEFAKLTVGISVELAEPYSL